MSRADGDETMEPTYELNPLVDISLAPTRVECPFRVDIYRASGRVDTEYVSTDVLELLNEIPDTASYEDICQIAADLGELDWSERVDALVESGILLPTEADDPYREWLEMGWREALYFHLATRNESLGLESTQVTSPRNSTECAASDAREDRGEKENAVELSVPERPLEASLAEALTARRTCRDFSGEAVSVESVGKLLWHSFTPRRDQAEGTTERRAGEEVAREQLFRDCVGLYVVAARVDGLEPGTYRYRIDRHDLQAVSHEPRTAANADGLVREILNGQPHAEGAAASLLVTVDFERYQRFRHSSRSFKELFTDVSRHAHRVLLSGTALQMGVFQSAALSDRRADDLVGVDGVDSAVGYLLSVGVPDDTDIFSYVSQ